MGLCKGEDRITTFGQQSEYNYKKLGKEQAAKMKEEHHTASKKIKPDSEIPWWRDGSIPGTKRLEKPLDVRKIKDTEKYIMTGETS